MSRKLFTIIFLVCGSVFCLLSYAQEGDSAVTDTPVNSTENQDVTNVSEAATENQDATNTSETSTEKQTDATKQQTASQTPAASDTKAPTTAKPAPKNSSPPPAPKKEPPPTPQNVQPQKSQPETSPSKEGAGDKTGNQSENDSSSEELPFNASFENDEFGAVSFAGKALITTNDKGERTLTFTEGKLEPLIFADQNTKLKESALIPALILAALAVAGLAFGIFNFIFGAKKKNLDQLNASIRDVKEENTVIKNDLNEARREEGDEYPVSPADVISLKNRIAAFEQDLRNLASADAVDKLSRRIAVLEDDKKTRDDIKKGTLDPLTVFNSWAADPAVDLPQAFYYLHVDDFRIRETHTLKESAAPSKWISNRYGNAKYLLPNPNSFEPMTNISELYDMDMTRLKTKGQNRIHVVKPCEMADNGYINYPGELELL